MATPEHTPPLPSKGKMWHGHPRWMWYTLAGAGVIAAVVIIRSRNGGTPTDQVSSAVDDSAPDDSGTLPEGSYAPSGSDPGFGGSSGGIGYADPGMGGSAAIPDPGLSSANTPEPVDNGPSAVTQTIAATHKNVVSDSQRRAIIWQNEQKKKHAAAAKKADSAAGKTAAKKTAPKVVKSQGGRVQPKTPPKPVKPAKKPAAVKKPAKPVVGGRGHQT